MSSGFISGGTADQPTERDDEWLQAQQEIEARRRDREEAGRQEGGKTLYEVLQNNKEEAFQESIKLKHQFRNLDEDEVEFLDSVLESTRAKELAVKEETREQLEVFRKQQEEADKKAVDGRERGVGEETAGSPLGESSETQWAVNARKRKRIKDENKLKGGKVRKSSYTSEAAPPAALNPDKKVRSEDETSKNRADAGRKILKSPEGTLNTKSAAKPHTATTDIAAPALQSQPTVATDTMKGRGLAGLGLADYSSDED
ncbi:MAG: hypothetical protein Q9191_005278 [Dirinaria sp. TL-2023a]